MADDVKDVLFQDSGSFANYGIKIFGFCIIVVDSHKGFVYYRSRDICIRRFGERMAKVRRSIHSEGKMRRIRIPKL